MIEPRRGRQANWHVLWPLLWLLAFAGGLALACGLVYLIILRF